MLGKIQSCIFCIRRGFLELKLLFKLKKSDLNDSKCMLATCGEDRKLKIWDVSRAGQTAAHSFDLVSTGSGLNFNSEDSKVTTGLQNGTIKLWDLESCKDFRVLSGHRAEVCLFFDHYSLNSALRLLVLSIMNTTSQTIWLRRQWRLILKCGTFEKKAFY